MNVLFLFSVLGSLGSNSFVEVSLNDAWQNLRNGVIKQLFQVSIKYDKNVSIYIGA